MQLCVSFWRDSSLRARGWRRPPTLCWERRILATNSGPLWEISITWRTGLRKHRRSCSRYLITNNNFHLHKFLKFKYLTQPITLSPAALLPSCARVWKFPPKIPLLCSSSAGEKQLIVVVFLSSSFPLLRKSRAGEFLAGTFKRARMTVIKRQDRKWRAALTNLKNRNPSRAIRSQHLMVVGIPAHPISYAGAVGVRLFQNKTADQSACVFCCRRPS